MLTCVNTSRLFVPSSHFLRYLGRSKVSTPLEKNLPRKPTHPIHEKSRWVVPSIPPSSSLPPRDTSLRFVSSHRHHPNHPRLSWMHAWQTRSPPYYSPAPNKRNHPPCPPLPHRFIPARCLIKMHTFLVLVSNHDLRVPSIPLPESSGLVFAPIGEQDPVQTTIRVQRENAARQWHENHKPETSLRLHSGPDREEKKSPAVAKIRGDK
ncbi:hypothetical protein QBC39DRAFT_96087 [Podospora conica]|nr:hypothetical protein QBC39DRAFT_96087 [Schizothecium conicum]